MLCLRIIWRSKNPPSRVRDSRSSLDHAPVHSMCLEALYFQAWRWFQRSRPDVSLLDSNPPSCESSSGSWGSWGS